METATRNIEKFLNSFLCSISLMKSEIKTETEGTVKQKNGIIKPAYSEDGTIRFVYSI
jgi:hypothetical protein